MEFRKDYNVIIKLILLFIGVVIITLGIKYYFQPLISIVILLVITKPLYKLMIKCKIASKVSAAISILLINIVMVTLILYLGNSIYNVTLNFYENNLYKVESLINNIFSLFNVESVSKGGTQFFNNDLIKHGAVSTGEWLFSYFVANIAVFFLLTDREKVVIFFRKLIPERVMKKIKRQKNNIINMMVIELILVLISTLEITLGFIILRVGRPVFWGIVCGVLDILPYVGTIIVFIPIIIYNIIVKEYIVSIGLTLLYILVQVSRQVLEAKFLSDKLELHPLLILLSIYVGMRIFGIIGAVVGPIYGLLAKEIIDSKV